MAKTNGKSRQAEHVPATEAEYVLSVRARLAGAEKFLEELTAQSVAAAAELKAVLAERAAFGLGRAAFDEQAKADLRALNQRVTNSEDDVTSYERALAEAEANVKALVRELEIAEAQEEGAEIVRLQDARRALAEQVLAAAETCGALLAEYQQVTAAWNAKYSHARLPRQKDVLGWQFQRQYLALMSAGLSRHVAQRVEEPA